MTEIEKIELAKEYILKLANGISPLDDSLIKDDDIVNNVKLSRCFFFVGDILNQVLQNGGTKKIKEKTKIPFEITQEQLLNFQYSETPITVTELVKRIYDATGNSNMTGLTYKKVNQWLINAGMLEYNEEDKSKYPTEAGKMVGLSVRVGYSYHRVYKVVTFNIDAQRLILDNIEDIVDTEIKKA